MSRRGLKSSRRFLIRQHPLTDAARDVLVQIGRQRELRTDGDDHRLWTHLSELDRHRLAVHVGHGRWVATQKGHQVIAHLLYERMHATPTTDTK